ncbi:WD40 repeat-like protein [Sanghuangporus baumii]|uniref:WD40 repeat-like protein n=1 Tax=Sanghuangporus baumii TaxID=108892 RepID=A0A9Q5N8Y7_SANBA|nr:WD40 repeat-like protein [Sanghuangporus baumii]
MEQNHFALQVIRVHRASSHTKDAAFYVEVKLANSYRKTGILNGNGEPIWNATVTFSQTEASTVFKIRLKEARKLGRDNLIGLAEVNVDGLLVDCDEDNARVVLSAPTGFLLNRKRQSSTGSIYLHLKNVDTLNRAKIEIETAEKSTERIRTLTSRTDSTMEVIGTVIEAAEVIIEMIDGVAKIHPLFNLSWQATSALFKLSSYLS